MDTHHILSHFDDGQTFTRSCFRETVHTYDPACADTAIDWTLASLRKQGVLASAGAGKYYVISPDDPVRRLYSYPHSEEYLALEARILEEFPLANYQMWELIQMNDCVNHQIAKNVIFVEVERMLIDAVYEMLHEQYPYAILQPDEDTFYRQRGPETDIVVQRLVSEAPTPGDHHSCSIEKILVDLLSKRLTGRIIERSEYPRIYEDMFRKYTIDESRMFRYARRRNLYDTLIGFITTQTNIRLRTL